MADEVEDTFDRLKAGAKAVDKKVSDPVKIWVMNTTRRKIMNNQVVMNERMT